MTARLKRLELEGFRGFAEREPIDLDADTVVVRGDNGTGKTSLVDGLLWLFCGELAHLADRVRGLRRAEDVVVNRFKPHGAHVALTVDVDGVDHIFTRTGNQKRNRLTALIPEGDLLEDRDAEAFLASTFGIAPAGDMRQAVLTWGLLRQDAIRAALDETGEVLHQRLAGLIGLERVSEFAKTATQAAEVLVRERTAASRARDQAAQRHEEAVQRRDVAQQAAGSATDVAVLLTEGVDAVRAKVSERVELIVDEPVDLNMVAQLGDAVDRVVAALAALHARQRAIGEHPADAEQLLEATGTAVSRAGEAAAESSERAPALVQLASAAMGLLGDSCPVCEQPIDEDSVRAHLQEVLDRSQALAADSQAAQDALVRAQADLLRARGVLEKRRIAIEDAETAKAELCNVLATSDRRLRVDGGEFDPPTVDVLLETLRAALVELRELYRTVNQASGAHVAQLTDECEAAAAELAATDERLVALAARCQTAKSLEHAAHDAAQTIMENTLEALRPSFAEVFDRLAPNPAFTELLAKQDVLRNRNQIVPMVRDRERGIEANPLLVFSEGQLNVVALSYFLGMALNARDASLPFLVLDDPLQAFDVIAILGFSDLCRQIRGQRQLIVTTHDRRFADVIVRKLSPRDDGETLLVHDFEGWTREGPIIRTSRPETEPVIRLMTRRAS